MRQSGGARGHIRGHFHRKRGHIGASASGYPPPLTRARKNLSKRSVSGQWLLDFSHPPTRPAKKYRRRVQAKLSTASLPETATKCTMVAFNATARAALSSTSGVLAWDTWDTWDTRMNAGFACSQKCPKTPHFGNKFQPISQKCTFAGTNCRNALTICAAVHAAAKKEGCTFWGICEIVSAA